MSMRKIALTIVLSVQLFLLATPVYAHYTLPHSEMEWILFTIFTITPIAIFILIFLKTKNK